MATTPAGEKPAAQFALLTADLWSQTKRVADQRISIAGRDYDCFVVRGGLKTGLNATAWIDKARGFVVKEIISSPTGQVTVDIVSIEKRPICPKLFSVRILLRAGASLLNSAAIEGHPVHRPGGSAER